MNRRQFLFKSSIAVIAGSFAGSCLSNRISPAKKPNVIILLTDDQGYPDLAADGNPFIVTPNMDRLYAESSRFTNFQVSPCCSPTRAALLTGRYPERSGITHVGYGQDAINKQAVTFADTFSAAGYKTALIGKWHLGANYPHRPQDKGFQEVFSFNGAHHGQSPDYWGNKRQDPKMLHNGQWVDTKGYVTDVIFNHAFEWITQNKDNQFICYIPTSAAHGPFQTCPEKYKKIYTDKGIDAVAAGFYGMLTLVDDYLGKLTQLLKDLHIDDNTLLIFLGDNGSDGGERFKLYNAGMKGGKNTVQEGGTRVFCMVNWPKHLPAGKDLDVLAAHIDIFPTISDFCNVPMPDGVKIDGRSLKNILTGSQKDWRDDRCIFINQDWFGPRYLGPEPFKYKKFAIRNKRFRLINKTFLYDMQNDIGQTTNVIDQYPDVAQKMLVAYDKWWEDIKSCYYKPTPLIIGAPQENPSHLCTWDWLPSRISSINGGIPLVSERLGKPNTAQKIANYLATGEGAENIHPPYMGNYAVSVAKTGLYRFRLGVIPSEAKEPSPLKPGKAFVKLGNACHSVNIRPGQDYVLLEVILKASGEDNFNYLECWFTGQLPDDQPLGAFYVEVEYCGQFSTKVPLLDTDYITTNPNVPEPMPDTAKVVLTSGQYLKSGEVITSANKTCSLTLTDRGILVLTKGIQSSGEILWESPAAGKTGDYFAMLQENGDFGIYQGLDPKSKQKMIWSTNTAQPQQRRSYQVTLWDDANLWLYSGRYDHNGGILWSCDGGTGSVDLAL